MGEQTIGCAPSNAMKTACCVLLPRAAAWKPSPVLYESDFGSILVTLRLTDIACRRQDHGDRLRWHQLRLVDGLGSLTLD
jgi:hypothetical protein